MLFDPISELKAWGSHPDIEQVGEGVHVLDTERVLLPKLIEQS